MQMNITSYRKCTFSHTNRDLWLKMILDPRESIKKRWKKKNKCDSKHTAQLKKRVKTSPPNATRWTSVIPTAVTHPDRGMWSNQYQAETNIEGHPSAGDSGDLTRVPVNARFPPVLPWEQYFQKILTDTQRYWQLSDEFAGGDALLLL